MLLSKTFGKNEPIANDRALKFLCAQRRFAFSRSPVSHDYTYATACTSIKGKRSSGSAAQIKMHTSAVGDLHRRIYTEKTAHGEKVGRRKAVGHLAVHFTSCRDLKHIVGNINPPPIYLEEVIAKIITLRQQQLFACLENTLFHFHVNLEKKV